MDVVPTYKELRVGNDVLFCKYKGFYLVVEQSGQGRVVRLVSPTGQVTKEYHTDGQT